jgi:archaeal flagellar protein FlaJ
MKFDKRSLIGVFIGLAMIIAGSILFFGTKLFYFIVVLALVIIALPFLIVFLIGVGRQKEKEERFLEFVRDLVENVKSGTPISKSIINLRGRNYGKLSGHVSRLANQISLGIPLTKALNSFAKDTRNKVILRAVGLISEAERAGGSLDDILGSVADSVNQTEQLKKERRSGVYNLIVQGYIIFLVFVIIMLVLQFYILPLTADLGDVSDLSVKAQSVSPEEFSTPLFVVLLVQSLFAGIVIGKVSEGSFVEGIKHSFILTAMALLIITGANAFLG